MTTALIITTYNRPEYLKRCLDSIRAMSELPDHILLMDDCSTDEQTIKLIKSFSLPRGEVGRSFGDSNRGIAAQLKTAFIFVFGLGFDLAINLDADAIVKPDFITRLKVLKSRYPEHIVSGFNCDNPRNPILYEGEDYVLRNHCNGINMCMDEKQFENIVLPALQSPGNWDYNSTHKLPIVISKPSVVQHTGIESSMGHNINPDISCDF